MPATTMPSPLGRLRFAATIAAVLLVLATVNVLIRFGPPHTGLVLGPVVAVAIVILARRYGLGFSRFASSGNQADLDLAELVSSYAAHEASRLIAIYAEDFRDGRGFMRAARDAGKPVVLMSAGRSAAGARTAYGHTGALVSEFPFGTAASSLTLRKRNKLIVAFAQGVLIGQSSAKGGAMNAYRFALEQRNAGVEHKLR